MRRPKQFEDLLHSVGECFIDVFAFDKSENDGSALVEVDKTRNSLGPNLESFAQIASFEVYRGEERVVTILPQRLCDFLDDAVVRSVEKSEKLLRLIFLRQQPSKSGINDLCSEENDERDTRTSERRKSPCRFCESRLRQCSFHRFASLTAI